MLSKKEIKQKKKGLKEVEEDPDLSEKFKINYRISCKMWCGEPLIEEEEKILQKEYFRNRKKKRLTNNEKRVIRIAEKMLTTPSKIEEILERHNIDYKLSRPINSTKDNLISSPERARYVLQQGWPMYDIATLAAYGFCGKQHLIEAIYRSFSSFILNSNKYKLEFVAGVKATYVKIKQPSSNAFIIGGISIPPYSKEGKGKDNAREVLTNYMSAIKQLKTLAKRKRFRFSYVDDVGTKYDDRGYNPGCVFPKLEKLVRYIARKHGLIN